MKWINVVEEMTCIYSNWETTWSNISEWGKGAWRKISWLFVDFILYVTFPIWGWWGLKILDYFWSRDENN